MGAANIGEHKQVPPVSAIESSFSYLFPNLNSLKKTKHMFEFASYLQEATELLFGKSELASHLFICYMSSCTK